jgi:hypothetical protein
MDIILNPNEIVTVIPVHIATIPKSLSAEGLPGLVFRDEKGRRAVIYLTDKMYRTLEVYMFGGIRE